MKIKHILPVLLTAIFAVTFGSTQAQIKYGLKAGMNFSNIVEKAANGAKSTTEFQSGIMLGFTVDVNLGGDFYLQPALQYARKGFKQKSGSNFGNATFMDVKVDYLELPINAVYSPKLGTGRLILAAGPYLGYGFDGKWMSSNNPVIGGIIERNFGKVAFRNDGSIRNAAEYNYGRPIDYGFNATIGYEVASRLSLQLNGMFGVANLLQHFNGTQPDGSLRNKSIGVALGYKF